MSIEKEVLVDAIQVATRTANTTKRQQNLWMSVKTGQVFITDSSPKRAEALNFKKIGFVTKDGMYEALTTEGEVE